jgi:uncharacterized RDD family membrane protein YckC
VDEQAPAAPPYAKIPDRFLAWLIDLAPFLLGYWGTLYYRLGQDPSLLAGGWRRVFAAWAAAYLLYQALSNMVGCTLGKRLLGLRVTHLDGAPLGPVRSVLRALGYVGGMPLLNIGFLWALFHPRSQGWHDLLAGSLVVESPPKSSAQTARNAFLSFGVLAALFAFKWWFFILSPTPADVEALRKAREGLKVLSSIEEAHRVTQGAYTDDLGQLARSSGNVADFKEAMGKLFDPDGFVLSVGKDSYQIRARALDRRRTEVLLEGPSVAAPLSPAR